MYTASHTSPVKDGRRVLGEKPANACLSLAFNRNVDKTASSSPLKRPFSENTPSSSPLKKKQFLLSPSFAGQKRGIDQVELQEEQENIGGAAWRAQEEDTRLEDVAATQTEREHEPTVSVDSNAVTCMRETQGEKLDLTADSSCKDAINAKAIERDGHI